LHDSNFHTEVNERALTLLERQSFIPSRLLENRVGENCMCVGAAVLYAAHLSRGGRSEIAEFFADLAVENEDSFIEKRARICGLDPIVVRRVVIVSKAIEECRRPSAVEEILRSHLS
jgi:hypothetical protein